MADDLPQCPKCSSIYTYLDGLLFVCPECAFEWSQDDLDEDIPEFLDANGIALQNGDTVTMTKDMKVKSSSFVIKVGSKIKNIRLNDDGRHIECKIDGVSGVILITPKRVKKV